MDYIITAFTKDELSQKIKKILAGSGIHVSAVCRSKAEIIRNTADIDSGLLITGYKLSDATADMIYEDLPNGFSMMVLASAAQSGMIANPDIFIQTLPVNAVELASSVNILLKHKYKSVKENAPARKAEDKKIIERAKLLLMERNMMTEEQAHRFIQKHSMDAGMSMVNMAKMILG